MKTDRPHQLLFGQCNGFLSDSFIHLQYFPGARAEGIAEAGRGARALQERSLEVSLPILAAQLAADLAMVAFGHGAFRTPSAKTVFFMSL